MVLILILKKKKFEKNKVVFTNISRIIPYKGSFIFN